MGRGKHTRSCANCKEVKSTTGFKGDNTWCSSCMKVVNFRHRLKTRFGIDEEEYNKLLLDADYKCEICRTPVKAFGEHSGERTRACIDHDHTTLEVRGILCQDCNFAVGLLKDDPQLCLTAAKYLYGRK